MKRGDARGAEKPNKQSTFLIAILIPPAVACPFSPVSLLLAGSASLDKDNHDLISDLDLGATQLPSGESFLRVGLKMYRKVVKGDYSQQLMSLYRSVWVLFTGEACESVLSMPWKPFADTVTSLRVGDAAESAYHTNPKDTAFDTKRFIDR